MARFGLVFLLLFSSFSFAGSCSESLLPGQVAFIDVDSSVETVVIDFVEQVMASAEPRLATFAMSEAARGRFQYAVRLSLDEGLKNAAEWGNRFRAGSTVRVTLSYTPREEGKLGILVATIRDQGEGYDTADEAHLFTGGDPTVHEEERERRRIRPGGRGRYLMQAYAHSSTYNQTNKTLYLHWDVQRFANE